MPPHLHLSAPPNLVHWDLTAPQVAAFVVQAVRRLGPTQDTDKSLKEAMRLRLEGRPPSGPLLPGQLRVATQMTTG